MPTSLSSISVCCCYLLHAGNLDAQELSHLVLTPSPFQDSCGGSLYPHS